MKIELRNIKHAAFASEETYCFSATVYVDGKKAGSARNAGKGGATDVWPPELEARLNAYAATLPYIDIGPVAHCGAAMEIRQTAETLIDDLLGDWLLERDLKRALSSRVLFVRGGMVLQTAAMNKKALDWNLRSQDLASRLRADSILNLLPWNEAVAAYKKALPA